MHDFILRSQALSTAASTDCRFWVSAFSSHQMSFRFTEQLRHKAKEKGHKRETPT
jgi:hypothetical protein